MLRLAHSAGPGFCSANWGGMAGKAVGTFAPLVARYGLESVPTHIEIIAELPACHTGAVTNAMVPALKGTRPRRRLVSLKPQRSGPAIARLDGLVEQLQRLVGVDRDQGTAAARSHPWSATACQAPRTRS
jgi:hypothetical protein